MGRTIGATSARLLTPSDLDCGAKAIIGAIAAVLPCTLQLYDRPVLIRSFCRPEFRDFVKLARRG